MRLLPIVLVSGEIRRLQSGDTISGACQIWTGSGNPDNGVGENGDLYFNSQQGDNWVKIAGTWTLFGANAYYLQGKGISGTSETTSPTNGHAVIYDSSLFGGAGGWKAGAVQGTSEIAVSGTQDGSNKTFTLASAITGAALVFVNGQLLRSGSGNDYLISGTTLTLQAAHPAPISTDVIQVFGYTGAAGVPYLYYRDEKANAVHGGGLTGATWNTRTLNTEVEDIGGYGSLASNQVTLAAGTYRVVGSAPAYNCDQTILRLRNITDGTTLLPGSACYATSAADVRAWVRGRFTITSAKAIELQHFVETTRATFGAGLASAAASGAISIYAELELFKEI